MFLRFFQTISIYLLAAILLTLAACSSISSAHDDPLNGSYDFISHLFIRNVWQNLRLGFSLPEETTYNPDVRIQINWLMSRPHYVEQLAEQARPYFYYVLQQVKSRHLPTELALLPMLESAYDPFAYSQMGAAGLWQIMPGTASGLGLKVNWWYDGRRDIAASTESALNYLAYLGNFFNKDWLLAVAAYHAGEGTVVAAIDHNTQLGLPVDVWSLPLPVDTQIYVSKLLALATLIKHPAEYAIDWPDIPNEPFLTTVNVGTQIDLSQAAQMAGLSLNELSRFNPGFSRWTTDPDGPYQLLVPIDKAEHFQQALAQWSPTERVTWIRYKVESGDTLSTIATHMKTTMTLLKQVNQLKHGQIYEGQVLLIPTQSNKLPKLLVHLDRRYFKTLSHRMPEIKMIEYSIQSGDSLERIAAHYHVTVNEIKFWNGIRSPKSLKPGQMLIIWPPRHKGTSTAHSKTAHSIRKTISKTRNNNAQHSVADKKRSFFNFISSSKKLVAPSKKTSSSISQPASHLKVLFHRIEVGENLQSVAKKFKVKADDIKRWNGLNKKDLDPHKTLIIYTKV